MKKLPSELVQLKRSIGKSDGDSTPPDLLPTDRSGGLNPIKKIWINGEYPFLYNNLAVDEYYD